MTVPSRCPSTTGIRSSGCAGGIAFATGIGTAITVRCKKMWIYWNVCMRYLELAYSQPGKWFPLIHLHGFLAVCCFVGLEYVGGAFYWVGGSAVQVSMMLGFYPQDVEACPTRLCHVWLSTKCSSSFHCTISLKSCINWQPVIWTMSRDGIEAF